MKKDKKNKAYKTQNQKIWTINFSNIKFVKRAQHLLPALKNRIDVRSLGLTILLAVEYCLQEQVVKDFVAYVNTRRRSLI